MRHSPKNPEERKPAVSQLADHNACRAFLDRVDLWLCAAQLRAALYPVIVKAKWQFARRPRKPAKAADMALR